MRIQILPLPQATVGCATSAPFVVILDECDDGVVHDMESLRATMRGIGAAGVLVFVDSVEVVR